MFVAYLIDNDSVAHGIGFIEVGTTREEAIAKLRATYEAAMAEEPELSWDASVQDGEEVLGWGTEKIRLFVTES